MMEDRRDNALALSHKQQLREQAHKAFAESALKCLYKLAIALDEVVIESTLDIPLGVSAWKSAL